MSAKCTIAHGKYFSLLSDTIHGGVYLELQTCDVELEAKDFMPNVKVRVRLPRELLERLTLDGQAIEDEPGWNEDYGGGWEFRPPPKQ